MNIPKKSVDLLRMVPRQEEDGKEASSNVAVLVSVAVVSPPRGGPAVQFQ